MQLNDNLLPIGWLLTYNFNFLATFLCQTQSKRAIHFVFTNKVCSSWNVWNKTCVLQKKIIRFKVICWEMWGIKKKLEIYSCCTAIVLSKWKITANIPESGNENSNRSQHALNWLTFQTDSLINFRYPLASTISNVPLWKTPKQLINCKCCGFHSHIISGSGGIPSWDYKEAFWSEKQRPKQLKKESAKQSQHTKSA